MRTCSPGPGKYHTRVERIGYVCESLIIVFGSGAWRSVGCQELTEGGLKVVLCEVGTRSAPVTRLRRHADSVGPSGAQNLEVNR